MQDVAGIIMSKDGSAKWAYAQKKWVKGLYISDNQGKGVLKELVDRANIDNGCWGDQAGIAHACGKSERTVRNHIRNLVDMGLIKVYERRGSNGLKLDDGYIVVGYQAPTKPPHEVLSCRNAVLKFGINATGHQQPVPLATGNADTPHQQPVPLATGNADTGQHTTLPVTLLYTLNSTSKLQRECEVNQTNSLAQLVETWNSHCGDLPRLEHLSEHRPEIVGLRKLLNQLGLEKARVLLRDATLGMAQDPWHAEKGLGLAFLLKNQRCFQLAEKHRAVQKKAQPHQHSDLELLEGGF